MSVAAARWAMNVLAVDPTIPRRCRPLLMALGIGANREAGHTCYPSIELLARTVGSCRRNVWHSLETLADRGLVQITARPGKTHLYRIPIEAVLVPADLSTAGAPIAWGSEDEARAIRASGARDSCTDLGHQSRDEGLEGKNDEGELRPRTIAETRALVAAARVEGRASLGVVNL